MNKLYHIGNRLIAARCPIEAVERAGLPPAYIAAAVMDAREFTGHLFRPGFYSGTTKTRAIQLGAHMGINVRAGEFWRNDYGCGFKIDRRSTRAELSRLGINRGM